MHDRGATRKMAADQDRKEALHAHHMQTLWVYWALVILGIWMIASPLTFDYGKGTVNPAGGREVWLSLKGRILALEISDLASGILLLIFGWRTLRPNRP